jgi:hypothetical protein
MLRSSAVTDEEVIAPRAIGMLQAARNGIDAAGVLISLLGHPPAFFAMHQPTFVTNQQERRVRFTFLLHL